MQNESLFSFSSIFVSFFVVVVVVAALHIGHSVKDEAYENEHVSLWLRAKSDYHSH